MDFEFDDDGFDNEDALLACDNPTTGRELLLPQEEPIDVEEFDMEDDRIIDEPHNISVGAEAEGYQQPVKLSDGTSGDASAGFDFSTGNLWIYPTNYPVRDYQYNIVQQALFKNTLVILPTGLGKTFIAAVVMYNFYRWFPQGKVVFMAPTKPLVAQQMQACYNIMGIPKSDTIEMTGTLHPSIRQRQWKEKRVIFLTPQVMTNDLSRGSCSARSFKCLVVDEAHKALGNQSYCQVIRELCKFTNNFRVLALSATPGSTLKAVQTVMNNLLVSHIELRTEDSIDIKPFTHERKVEKVVVPLGEELTAIKQQYIQIMSFVTQRLTKNRALFNREATSLSKFLLLKARDEFRQNPPQNMQAVQRGAVEADFCLAISLYHGFDLLQLHGLRSLYNFLMGILAGDKGYGRTRAELLRNADFNSIMDKLHSKFSSNSNTVGDVSGSTSENKIIAGHPKMQILEQIVVDHFQSYKNKNIATKVVIFSQFRDSVQEIAAILNQHQPLVKVMPFIGQSSAGKDIKGYTQKEQLEVMRQFREAGCNTLVSTCVGEEGLDIGDVDLIVCFDAHKSPIRLVQRMGRTGRKREGKIIMLVTEGKEEQIYNQSLSSKKSIHKAILNGAKSLRFYPNNPRMLPLNVRPQCHKMFITIPAENQPKVSNSNKRKSSEKRQSIAEAFKKQGSVKTTYEMLTNLEYEDIKEEFALMSSSAKHLPKPGCLALLSKCKKTMPQGLSDAGAVQQSINFTEWSPWQNRLQKTFLFGHSIQSEHLVKNAEFIEIQHVVGEDEDHYGIEMKSFLNKSFVSQSCITSFLSTPQAKQQKSSKQDETNTTHLSKEHRTICGVTSSQSNAQQAASSTFTKLRGSKGVKGTAPSSEKSCTSNIVIDEDENSCQVQSSKKKMNFTQSLRTPSNSKKTRVKLLRKSKKMLQKRKSSILHLLESKLGTVSQTKDCQDFEDASQDAIQLHDDGDKLDNFDGSKDVEDNNAENLICFSDTVRQSSKRTTNGEAKTSQSTQNHVSIPITDKSKTPKEKMSMVPPAPPLSGVADLVLDTLEHDLAVLDLEEALKDLIEVGHDSGFGPIKDTLGDVSSEQSIVSSTKTQKLSFIDFGSFGFESKNGVEEDIGVEGHDIVKDEIAVAGSPTFKSSGHQCLNQSIDKISENGNGRKDVSNGLSSHGVRPGEEPGQVSLPSKISTAEDCIFISPMEANTSLGITSPIISMDLQNSRGKNVDGKPPHLSNAQESQLIMPDPKEEEPSHCKKESLKKSEKSRRLSQSFVTLTQAMDCILTSSSENSHDGINQSIPKPNTTLNTSSQTKPSNVKANISRDESVHTKDQPKAENISNIKTEIKINMSGLQDQSLELFDGDGDSILAQFDLGFDLDEDVIPPTPAKESPRNSILSQNFKRSLFSIQQSSCDQNSTQDQPGNSKPSVFRDDLDHCAVLERQAGGDAVSKNFDLEMDVESAFDLCAEMDEIDLCSDAVGANELVSKISPEVKESHPDFSDCVPADEKQSSSSAVKVITTLDSPIQESPTKPLPFQSYAHSKSSKDNSLNEKIEKKRNLSTSETSPGSSGKKFSKLRLGKKRGQNSESSHQNDESDKSEAHLGSPLEQKATPINTNVNIVKTKVGKLHFNLHIPDFSDDDDIIPVFEKKATSNSKSSLPNTAQDEPSAKTQHNHLLSPLRDIKNVSNKPTKFAPSQMKCSTPVRPMRGEILNREDCSITSFTESIIQGGDLQDTCDKPKKRKSKRVIEISSSEEDAFDHKKFRLLEQEKEQNKKQDTSSSFLDEDQNDDKMKDYEEALSLMKSPTTPEKTAGKKIKTKVATSSSNIGDMSEDDMEDFEAVLGRKKNPTTFEKPVKIKRKRHNFIEDEAEVSGDTGSSDEDEGKLGEEYEMSFIDNQTEAIVAHDTDMQAFYLKSVKSPPLGKVPGAVSGGRFKLQYEAPKQRREDIYSQAPEESQGLSEYEEDSFCVGSEVEDEEESSPEKARRKKSKKSKLKQVSGKRQLRMIDSSSDEENSVRLPVTQEFRSDNCKRTALLSSEEEEVKVKRQNQRRKNVISDETYTQLTVHTRQDVNNYSRLGKNDNIHNLLDKDEDANNVVNNDNFPEDGDFDLLGDEFMHELDSGSDQVVKHKTECDGFKKNNRKSVNVVKLIPKTNDSLVNQEQNDMSFNNLWMHTAEKDRPRVNMMHHQGLPEDSQMLKPSKWSHEELNLGKADEEQKRVSGRSPVSLGQIKNVNHLGSIAAKKFDCDKSNVAGTSGLSLSREERLQRQREKQEHFRKRLAQAQIKQADLRDDLSMQKNNNLLPKGKILPVNTTNGTQLETVHQARDSCVGGRANVSSSSNISESAMVAVNSRVHHDVPVKNMSSSEESFMTNHSRDMSLPGSSRKNRATNEVNQSTTGIDADLELQILVDSREISGAQDIISSLRIQHSITVTARRLPACDYIVSNYTAVDRMLWSAFSNSSNRSKLSSRLNEMQSLYDKCVLIVEDDKPKTGHEKAKKQVHHTKYVDSILAYLVQSKVKVYFTSNNGETVSVLVELCKTESRKKRHFTASASVSDKKEERVNFLLAAPGVTVPQALNLVQRYRNIVELVNSPVQVIQERGQMSLAAAQSIHKFLRHFFDQQMLPQLKR